MREAKISRRELVKAMGLVFVPGARRYQTAEETLERHRQMIRDRYNLHGSTPVSVGFHGLVDAVVDALVLAGYPDGR